MFGSHDAIDQHTWAPSHPDAGWLDQIQAAAEAWRSAPVHEPTSSLTGGGVIRAFEEAFSRHVGSRESLLVPSATYGLRLALETLGVGAGEVIVPAVDWTATQQAVRSLGATPVLADVEPDTLTIRPGGIASLINERTKAVVACHYNGSVADVAQVREAVGGLPIVEDCAAALDATLDGQPVGTLGDIAVFSFGPGKHFDLGEGGMVVSANASLHERALALSAHPTRLTLSGIDIPADHPGLMMRGNPLTALLGWHALDKTRTASGPTTRAADQK